MSRAQEIEQRLGAVRQRITTACEEAGREPEEVTLVVVTKYFPAADVRVLHDLGVRDVGENKHQEVQAKAAELADLVSEEAGGLRWHFVGGLQSNKAAAVASYAAAVHSLDRVKLVKGLSRGALERGRDLDVLVQVSLDPPEVQHEQGPGGRAGVPVGEVAALVERVQQAEGLRLRGVMAVAPLDGDPAAAFAELARVAADVRRAEPGATWISAGMSGDLEQAVRHGATHLRVGSAVLGPRPTAR